MQTILALSVVGFAVAYLIFRACRKGKPGCDAGCGCTRGNKNPLPPKR